MRLVLLDLRGWQGTVAQLLVDRFAIPQISTGDILREHVQRGSGLGIQARVFMDCGEYVLDELVVRMVMDRLAQPDAREGFILDGFPRRCRRPRRSTALEQTEQPLGGAEVRDQGRHGRATTVEPMDVPGVQAHLQHGVQAAGERPGLRHRRHR